MSKFALLAMLLMPNRPDVLKAVMQIHHDQFETKLKIEEALLVKKDSVDFVSGSDDSVQFKWSDDIIMIIHTHPDSGFEKPSQTDIDDAVKYHISVYVISKDEIWYATPAGQVKQLVVDKSK